jgi:hypothetical protein
MDRRDFLRIGAGFGAASLAGAAAIPSEAQAAAPKATRGPLPTDSALWTLDHLTLDFFSHHVGQTFEAANPIHGAVPLKLVQVVKAADDLTHNAEGKPFLDTFTLYFEGPAEAPLAQGMHVLSNRALGRSALFLTPCFSPNPHRHAYQAVFNRML